jgi:hypothetical protein
MILPKKLQLSGLRLRYNILSYKYFNYRINKLQPGFTLAGETFSKLLNFIFSKKHNFLKKSNQGNIKGFQFFID